jgi:phospholipase C
MGESPATVRRKGRKARYYVAIGGAAVLGAGLAVAAAVPGASAAPNTVNSVPVPRTSAASSWTITPSTATPIKHVVVLFGENESFDHYFGTYPYAANTDGSKFTAKPGTPKVNGLYTKITKSGPTGPLLTANANEYDPQRLTHSEALTCDQNHSYTPEQEAYDGGKMDKFVQDTESASTCAAGTDEFFQPGLVMDYYDGNTVTALWNYAQNYTLDDNNYDSDFGPSTPGALNVISGDDGHGYAVSPSTGAPEADAGTVSALNSKGLGTIYGDLDPAYDQCSDSSHTSTSPVGVMTGKNIGDLLNARGVSWGWFQGGFAPTSTKNGYAVCGAEHENVGGNEVLDYSPHHNPFEYYKSTANPKHLAPSSEAAIGHTDRANHEYDLSDFYTTLKDGNMPAVSFLKAAEYQDAHPGYSDPLDEQTFLVNTINQIEKSKFWSSTAIVIDYDDSDGWYDHVDGPVVNGSNTTADEAVCTAVPEKLNSYPDRCGFGPRLPLLVISPYTRANSVSNKLTNQASVISFIENNWLDGKRIGNGSYDEVSNSVGSLLNFHSRPNYRPVILNPTTGEVVSG